MATMKEIYTVYAKNDDMTFIMCDTTEDGEISSTEVVGWYWGEPNDEATAHFVGKVKAIY